MEANPSAQKSKLLVISGPSGVGKDTIMRLFLQKHPDWRRPISVTTRSPRAGEKPGQDYIFASRDEFEKKVKSGEFLEWVEYTGNLYGTLKPSLEAVLNTGHNVVLRVEIQGALIIKKKFPAAITICLLPEQFEILEQRFRSRATDSEEMTKARIELAKEEITYKDEFDHVIINAHDRHNDTVQELEGIIGC